MNNHNGNGQKSEPKIYTPEEVLSGTLCPFKGGCKNIFYFYPTKDHSDSDAEILLYRGDRKYEHVGIAKKTLIDALTSPQN
jgi:hypothetical protein